MKHNSTIIHITNKSSQIQAKCPQGRKLQRIKQQQIKCEQAYKSTELWAIMDCKGFKIVYVPIMQCCYHRRNNISKVYGYRNDDERFIKGNDDVVINYYPIWSCVKWGTPEKCVRNWWKARYHFSDMALEEFTDHFLLQSYVIYIIMPDSI